MALTIVIKGKAPAPDHALTFDSSRIVIGRGKSCDLSLPDPSVAKRHASIRREGGKTLIVDEGSANGLVVDQVTLPAHAPSALENGALVRVGRFWLEIRQAGGVASAQDEVRRVALALVKAGLEAEGEPASASLEVLGADGPTGQRLELADPMREYVVGRGRDTDLTVADELASRRHVALSYRGDGWNVYDLGSKQGTVIQARTPDDAIASEAPLGTDPRPLRPRELVRLGNTRLQLVDPVVQALDEALAAPELKMRPADLREPPPGGHRASSQRDRAHPRSEDDPHGDDDDALDSAPGSGRSNPFATVDALVILVAIALLVVSAIGLVWVLH
ncbi:MAG: FHA domain-containing protein [Deltaproteobacteria bacterium]|nr:FHA domain-containing protein [Deltaproteobacteria bacterium]